MAPSISETGIATLMPIMAPVAKPLEDSCEELGIGTGDAGVEEVGSTGVVTGVRLLAILVKDAVLVEDAVLVLVLVLASDV